MKTTSIALLAALIAGVSAPVFAYDEGDGPVFDASGYTTALEHKGYNVLDVEQNGAGQIVATVRDANGHQSFAYFNDETLQPLNNVANDQPTRVLSKLDVVR